MPFELGRPLGVPNDEAFQGRVLLKVLKLLEAESGPLIEDFLEDAPVSGKPGTLFACPVDLAPERTDTSIGEKLCGALEREINQLRSWYDLAVQRRGRTTVGLSGLDPDAIGGFLCAFLDGEMPGNPREDIPLGFSLKLAVDDLKAYYTEAVTAQPGQGDPGSGALLDWFWGETTAAKVLLAIKDSCVESHEPDLQLVGKMLLVPMTKKRDPQVATKKPL